MKKLLLPILALILCTITTVHASSGQQYGTPLTLNTITKVSDIEKNPEGFVGKKVQVTGTIVEVCAKRGCWMNISSDTPFEKIQIKVVDGVIVFPMSARGHKARVEGIVEKLSFSKKQAIKYRKHKAEESGKEFDPTSVTGSETIYRIRALGAVIEK
jgi:hypothetical protein